MGSPFHEGELAVQKRAGVAVEAARLGRSIFDMIPRPAQRFLLERRFAVLGAADEEGRVWASLLAGPPGFLQTVDERTVRINTALPTEDPLANALHDAAPVGLVAIHFATRRRMRLNGEAHRTADGAIELHARECFGNCPRFIRPRREEEVATKTDSSVAHGTALNAEQQRWIAAADTFFVASRHPEAGVDASHRGGDPGFVQVLDERTLRWPDYPGNNMFQTLGNMAIDPAAGLLFLDFETGSTLQLSGRARTLWEPGRSVEFRVEQVVEGRGAVPLRWKLEMNL
ncbi:MAG TPA: pyridoxamine 5'-phosphate oxidase family protein [Terriglobales bacterium]|nr:pyridoxamine 5'-phosphate oxidase family protein [Terriglobales bacterium]